MVVNLPCKETRILNLFRSGEKVDKVEKVDKMGKVDKIGKVEKAEKHLVRLSSLKSTLLSLKDRKTTEYKRSKATRRNSVSKFL